MQFQRSTIAESVLAEIIDDRLVRREAANRGIVVTADDVETKVRQSVSEYAASLDPQPTPTSSPTAAPDATPTSTPVGTPTPRPTATPAPTLTDTRYTPLRQELLTAMGVSEEQYRREVESELYEERLRAALGNEVSATQEQVRARHIVLKSEEEARATLQQLRAGADFVEVAKVSSQDALTKDLGGDLDWLPRKGFDPAFDQAAFALQPGELSEPVQTTAGWEVIQVLERAAARPVEQSLLEQLRRRKYGEWQGVAVGSPEIERKLSSETSAWVLQRAGGRRQPS
jgi:hypothetical protein